MLPQPRSERCHFVVALVVLLLLPSQACAQPEPNAATPAVEVKVEKRAVQVGRLEIPQELGPAISPYLMCRLKAAGVRMRSADGTLPDTAEPSGQDCAPVRAAARRKALSWLEENTNLRPSQRVAEVDKALSDVDSFVQAASPESGSVSRDDHEKK